MWWRKKAVPKDRQEEPPGGTYVGKRADLPFSPKDILSMVTNSKTLPVIFHLKNFISNILIEDESGKKALEDLTVKLQLKFPVEFEFRPGESWALQYPIVNVLRTDERGGFVLSLKHHASYSERDTLVNGIYFLNGAKMVETSFPGILVEGDERKRSSFAEIAYQIKEPYSRVVILAILDAFIPTPFSEEARVKTQSSSLRARSLKWLKMVLSLLSSFSA